MNTETAKRRAIVEILNAAADGKSIRYARCQSVDVFDPNYRNILFQYPQNFCIAPEPKTRPWSKPSDLPDGTFYIRKNGEDDCWAMCIGAGLLGIEFTRAYGEVGYVNWGQLKPYRYSTDRKTWHKCEVTEEAQ